MAAHLFNESGQMQEVDIPDIFDVLEGGEDESAVKFLLGFNAEDAASDSANEILNNNGLVQQVLASPTLLSPKVETKNTPARVVVQIEPPVTTSSMASSAGNSADLKTDKPRKREPVDPSRCIYACESCGKAFTTKFNLKRHINMHCSRSREAGVPIQGPPSASQPSRKNKNKDDPAETVAHTQLKVRRVSSSQQASPQPIVKTVPVVTTTSKAYQAEPMTVQLAVNAQGQLTAAGKKPASLPVQPLPESAVQIIQSLGGAVAVSSGNTQRIVRVINAPQIIATQSRAGITTGATVQLQAIPVTQNHVTFPQQPLPIVQQIGTRQIVLSTNNLTKLKPEAAENRINITPVQTSNIVTSTSTAADLIYRSIVSSKATSPTLTPLQAVVTSSTISSPTCGFNPDGPPADLFDSEDGDALSVATTTETPTPPPSLNGDPILPNAPVMANAIKSLPDGGGELQKVVVIPEILPATQSHCLTETLETGVEESDTDNTAEMTLPSNRFHGQLTSIPKGWLRKVVTTGKGFQKVFYYNPVGKRFSCQEEIDQYFARLGYSVPLGLFNFELPKLVDEEDEDEEIDEDDLDEASSLNNKNTIVVKVTSNAKGEATVTPVSTVVTRADTTVDQSTSPSSSRSSVASTTAAQSSNTTLVTSTTKQKAFSGVTKSLDLPQVSNKTTSQT